MEPEPSHMGLSREILTWGVSQTPSPKPKLEAGVKKKKKDESGSQEEHKPKKKTKKTDTAAGPGVINNYHGITFSNIVGSSIVAFCKDGATGGDPTSTGSDPAATNDE